MIDHITIPVSDLAKSKLFYERAFAPLGHKLSFGKEGTFWSFDVGDGSLFEIQEAETAAPFTHLHVAFRARRKAEVNGFYQAALEAGAKDNGAPARGRNTRPIITPASFSPPVATTSKP